MYSGSSVYESRARDRAAEMRGEGAVVRFVVEYLKGLKGGCYLKMLG